MGGGSEAQEASRTQMRRTTKASGKVWTFFWGAMRGVEGKPSDRVPDEIKKVTGGLRVSPSRCLSSGPRSHLRWCSWKRPGRDQALSLSPSGQHRWGTTPWPSTEGCQHRWGPLLPQWLRRLLLPMGRDRSPASQLGEPRGIYRRARCVRF